MKKSLSLFCITISICYAFFFHLSFLNPVKVFYTDLSLQDCEEISREEIVDIVNKIFSCPDYCLKFCDLPQNVGGQYTFISNTVVINQNISNLELPVTLAHELTHKVFNCRNEKAVITVSLNILLESNNVYCVNSAKNEIRITLDGGYKDYEMYDISEFLVHSPPTLK